MNHGGPSGQTLGRPLTITERAINPPRSALSRSSTARPAPQIFRPECQIPADGPVVMYGHGAVRGSPVIRF